MEWNLHNYIYIYSDWLSWPGNQLPVYVIMGDLAVRPRLRSEIFTGVLVQVDLTHMGIA